MAAKAQDPVTREVTHQLQHHGLIPKARVQAPVPQVVDLPFTPHKKLLEIKIGFSRDGEEKIRIPHQKPFHSLKTGLIVPPLPLWVKKKTA